MISRWYLLNARPREIKQVWLWDEWPERTGPDCGIDLVAKTHAGELWAVQCKAVAPDHDLKKREIDSFLAESNSSRFARRVLISTTDRIGANARRALRAQEKPVEVIGPSHLGRAPVRWPRSLGELLPAPVRSLALKRHQAEALRAIEDGLRDGERGQVIMACGTGKTLVAIRARERLNAAKTLVLVPSLRLMRQTIETWQAQAATPFRRLAVCSDETVDRVEDAVPADVRDLGVSVTTDPAVIAKFLALEAGCVVFSTYQSSPQMADACRGGSGFDLVVADEAHWAAGPADGPYATVLHDDAIPARRRLFLTATPRRFNHRAREIAKQQDVRLASMDDEALFGPVFHRLSFGEAIRQGLLADYRVVVCVVDDRERLALTHRRGLVHIGDDRAEAADDLAAKVVLARAIRTWNLRRVLTFHGRVARAGAFAQRFPSVVRWMPKRDAPKGEVWARHVHGDMADTKRDALLSTFATLDRRTRGIIANVRCLAEGVDVPSIDGVAINDPKRAHNEIIQAVGRALRTDGRRGKVATIIVPAFIPRGADPIASLSGSAFEPVWNVLSALRDYDERLADECDDLRLELGQRAPGHDWGPSRVQIDVPQLVGDEFVRAFNAAAIRELGATRQSQIRSGRIQRAAPVLERDDDWEPPMRYRSPTVVQLGLEALERFVTREGHAQVPPDHREEGFGLGEWLHGALMELEDHAEFRVRWLMEEALPRPVSIDSWFPNSDLAETFHRLFQPRDIRTGEHPNLLRAIDPCWDLRRFQRAVADGSLASDLDASLVSLDDFPYRDFAHAYAVFIGRRQPKDHHQLYAAAVDILRRIKHAEQMGEAVEPRLRQAFYRGFGEGLSQPYLDGCLIDRVTVHYRKRDDLIQAYVKGWDATRIIMRDDFREAA